MKQVKVRTANHVVPFIAVEPGLTIRDSIRAEDITEAQFAQELGLTLPELEALLIGKAELTPEIALSLEKRWGVPREIWLKLEAGYRAHPKNPWGGARVGAGRKPLELKSKQVRISAPPDDFERIETWLKAQPSAAQSLAKLILAQTTKPAKRSKR
jgi:plasmid maintenance system antidote protein VapI